MNDSDALGTVIFIAVAIFGAGYWVGYDPTEVTPLENEMGRYILEKNGDVYSCRGDSCRIVRKEIDAGTWEEF